MTCPRGAKLPAGVDQEQDLAFPPAPVFFLLYRHFYSGKRHLELQEAITVETHLLLLVCCCLFLQL